LAAIVLWVATIVCSGVPTHADASRPIAIDIRKTVNPFDPDQEVAFVRIVLGRNQTDVTYALNGRSMTTDALDATLGKLSDMDRNQVIAIDPQAGVNLDDMAPLLKMLKKHQFRNVARRGDENSAIWMAD